MKQEKLNDLERQGYRVVGNHSAIKICHWTRECIRGKDVCYKNTFYGINTHQCVQMTPVLQTCTHRCVWCWRDIDHTDGKWVGKIDLPEKIIEGCIEAQKQVLIGFKGNDKVDDEVFKEAMQPKHFAISLTGEPTFYPYLPEMIGELKKRKITSFLVTNGTNPAMLNKLISNPPTQLYLTLPAPDLKTYKKVCFPLIDDGWKKIMESLSLLSKFPRTVVRLTLVKDVNMNSAEKYAELITDPDFIELKGYAWVGHSQERLTPRNQPTHEEIKEFAKTIAQRTGYHLVDEKINSRVVLLAKSKDFSRHYILD